MVRTLDNNLIHLPTDTPTYEKKWWTGDAQTALPLTPTSYDAERLLTKWLCDLRGPPTARGVAAGDRTDPRAGFEGWQSPGVDHRLAVSARPSWWPSTARRALIDEHRKRAPLPALGS